MRVRDLRLRLAPLEEEVLEDIESERARAGARAGRTAGTAGDDIGWAIEAFEVASKPANGDSPPSFA